MLPDAFLLSFKLLQETQLVVRITQEFKDGSKIYLSFSVTFLSFKSMPDGWGFFPRL